jgi:NitT/TauT family transport system substrate-binding protein
MNLLALSFPNIAAALATRQVDVAFLSEPFATNAFDKGIAVKWREQADFLPSHPQSIWLGSQKLLTDKIEAGRRFMVSMVQGARDYEDAFGKNKGRQAVVDILINHTTVKDAALYDKLNWAKMPENGEVRTDLLKEDVDWLVAQGSIPEVPELSRLVDARLTDYAVQRLGPSR